MEHCLYNKLFTVNSKYRYCITEIFYKVLFVYILPYTDIYCSTAILPYTAIYCSTHCLLSQPLPSTTVYIYAVYCTITHYSVQYSAHPVTTAYSLHYCSLYCYFIPLNRSIHLCLCCLFCIFKRTLKETLYLTAITSTNTTLYRHAA